MQNNRFYRESLPLLASYFSGNDVLVSDINTSVINTDNDGFIEFEAMLVARHLISYSQKLYSTLKKIERNYSTITVSTKAKSKGSIRGRLDTSAYIYQKFQQSTFPKSYPIIVSNESPNTPENLLARALLEKTLAQLGRLIIPKKSAEFILANKFQRYFLGLKKSVFWSGVHKRNDINRLALETRRRVARRQTGNEFHYKELLNIFSCLHFDFANLSAVNSDSSDVSTSFVFPEDKNFSDRLFEIWCLSTILYILRDLGCINRELPRKLTDRGMYPICVFEKNGLELEVWFQKKISTPSAWKYSKTGRELIGMPDIVITSSNGFRMIIDAKNKLVTTNTRAEETYKILGYFENYKDSLASGNNWGLLIFTTLSSLSTSLESDSGSKILLTAAHAMTLEKCEAKNEMTNYIGKWLDTIS